LRHALTSLAQPEKRVWDHIEWQPMWMIINRDRKTGLPIKISVRPTSGFTDQLPSSHELIATVMTSRTGYGGPTAERVRPPLGPPGASAHIVQTAGKSLSQTRVPATRNYENRVFGLPSSRNPLAAYGNRKYCGTHYRSAVYDEASSRSEPSHLVGADAWRKSAPGALATGRV